MASPIPTATTVMIRISGEMRNWATIRRPSTAPERRGDHRLRTTISSIIRTMSGGMGTKIKKRCPYPWPTM
jgi:hypothetical protein